MVAVHQLGRLRTTGSAHKLYIFLIFWESYLAIWSYSYVHSLYYLYVSGSYKQRWQDHTMCFMYNTSNILFRDL